MIAENRDHFKVVTERLVGLKPIDDETFSSIAVLAERLERLKKTNDKFAEVTFSPHVEELASCEMISAIS